MSRPFRNTVTAWLVLSVLVTGCTPTQPFYFHEDGDLSHYIGRATEIEYPDVETCRLDEVDQAGAPLTLDNDRFDAIWELSLAESVRLALKNSKVMRSLGGRVDAASEQLLRNPDGAISIYTPALQETSIGLFAPIGPEAALSAFDAQFTSSMFWEKNDTPNNSPSQFLGGLPVGALGRPFATQQDLGTFQAELSKTAASGTQMFFRNITRYEQNNNSTEFRPLASEFRTNVEAEIRQPLLQGAGTQYNRIAGPFSPFGGVGTRAFDGVVIARINTDRSLADFEAGVRDLVRDVEFVYWELYFAYRNLEARKVGLTSSLKTWQTVQSITEAGGVGGGPEREALAREQYFSFRAQVEAAKSELFAVESRLRFIMGLASADGRLIRPSDEPTSAKMTFEWHDIVGESLGRNVDLRKQKWRIKQRELELIAAKNHLLPRLDAVGRYRWTGFGDTLIDPNSDGEGRFDNAFANLADGDFQDWQMGLQFSMNLGFRQELAGVRNAQLTLQRDKAILKEQELELSHLLAESIRQIDQQFQLIETNFNRRVAAQTQVETFQVKVDIGIGRSTEQLDLLLGAQRSLADAEAAYYRAVIDYNRAITLLHFQKGSLLENNSVWLAEGPWPGKAYFDATRLARQRDASMYLDYGFTRPREFSRGPYDQHGGSQAAGQPMPATDSAAPATQPELLPTPEPEPSENGPAPPSDGSPRLTRGPGASPWARSARQPGPNARPAVGQVGDRSVLLRSGPAAGGNPATSEAGLQGDASRTTIVPSQTRPAASDRFRRSVPSADVAADQSSAAPASLRPAAPSRFRRSPSAPVASVATQDVAGPTVKAASAEIPAPSTPNESGTARFRR